MAVHWFDVLVRHLMTGVARRGVLAGGVGAALSVAAGRTAEAGCKKEGKKCDKNKDCCDGARCKGGKNGKCRCKTGFADCGGTGNCDSLANDDLNCGACGVACAEAFCSDGVCRDCVPVTPPFAPAAGSCTEDRECCKTGRCCTLDVSGGPISICIDTLTNPTACGLSCDSLVNCFLQDLICINGTCVGDLGDG